MRAKPTYFPGGYYRRDGIYPKATNPRKPDCDAEHSDPPVSATNPEGVDFPYFGINKIINTTTASRNGFYTVSEKQLKF